MKESQFQRCRKVGRRNIYSGNPAEEQMQTGGAAYQEVMHEDMEEFRIGNADQEERQISRRHRLAEETD